MLMGFARFGGFASLRCVAGFRTYPVKYTLYKGDRYRKITDSHLCTIAPIVVLFVCFFTSSRVMRWKSFNRDYLENS